MAIDSTGCDGTAETIGGAILPVASVAARTLASIPIAPPIESLGATRRVIRWNEASCPHLLPSPALAEGTCEPLCSEPMMASAQALGSLADIGTTDGRICGTAEEPSRCLLRCHQQLYTFAARDASISTVPMHWISPGRARSLTRVRGAVRGNRSRLTQPLQRVLSRRQHVLRDLTP